MYYIHIDYQPLGNGSSTFAYITFAYNVCHTQLRTSHLRTMFVIHSCVHHTCVQYIIICRLFKFIYLINLKTEIKIQ